LRYRLHQSGGDTQKYKEKPETKKGRSKTLCVPKNRKRAGKKKTESNSASKKENCCL
jgi:hypothetical protein